MDIRRQRSHDREVETHVGQWGYAEEQGAKNDQGMEAGCDALAS